MTKLNNLITDNIDIWTCAIKKCSATGRGSSKKIKLTGINKLRELILELAVRGKLVPQQSNEEPASVLLERISAERKQLVVDKKIKNQKLFPPVSEENKPFALPLGWQWSRLGNLFELEYGNNLPKSKRSETGEYPVYGSNGVVSTHNDLSIAKPCIVIGRKGSAGALNLCEHDGCWVTDVAYSVVPSQHLNLQFIFKSFHTFGLDSLGKGIKPGLNRNDAYMVIVAIPPLEEQKRISEKVDELMTLCDQLEQQTEDGIQAHQTLVEVLLNTFTNSENAEEFQGNWQLIAEQFDTLFTTEESIEQLIKTILQLAVMGKLVPQDANDESAAKLLERIKAEKEKLIKDNKIKKLKVLPEINEEEKPFELPERWSWCNLNQLIVHMDAGWSPACLPEKSPNSQIWGVLKTTSVQPLEYRQHENKTLPDSKEPRPKYEVKKGDILITRAGPKNRVGISCLVEETRPNLMISDKIIRFQLVELGISEKYIALCLNAGSTAKYIDSVKSGMAESQMNISQDKLKLAPIPLAPLRVQHETLEKVDSLITLCNKLKTNIQQNQVTKVNLAETLVKQGLRH